MATVNVHDDSGLAPRAAAWTDGNRPAGPSAASAVSWGAIFAGAAAAAALSLILLILGTGLGLSSVSPWSGDGISGATFGVSTVLWLTLTQLLASGMGGYLAGRLRARWIAVHTDEVYFRDTAHGFLAWAVATLVTAAMLGSAVGAIVGKTAQAGASVAGGTATAAVTAVAGGAAAASDDDASSGPLAYFVDGLFRPAVQAAESAAAPAAAASDAAPGSADAAASAPGAAASSADAAAPAGAAPATPADASRTPGTEAAGAPAQATEGPSAASAAAQVGRIFTNALRTGSLPADDAAYVASLVSSRTGLSQAQAQQRVSTAFTRLQERLQTAQTEAREAADTARKASAKAALWMFVSLLAGAFVASLMATWGGRQRDA